MTVTRRDFLKYCAVSATALGLCPASLRRLEAAVDMPTIVWLHGSGCQGDSVSFLNRIAAAAPVGQRTVDDILVNSVNLAYHTVVMSASGETAVTMAKQAKRKGGYVLVCEGAVPTSFNGRACQIWSYGNENMTYQQAVVDYATDAAAVVCVGTCACYGGIPASGSNPTGAISVKDAIVSTGKGVINIPGCPAHPDWIAYVVVQLILGNPIPLDGDDRPIALYGDKAVNNDFLIHDNCPRNVGLGGGNAYATTFGEDLLCLEDLGCRGPLTYSDCPSRKWNNGANWCVDSNGMCLGCVEPTFPGGDFYA